METNSRYFKSMDRPGADYSVAQIITSLNEQGYHHSQAWTDPDRPPFPPSPKAHVVSKSRFSYWAYDGDSQLPPHQPYRELDPTHQPGRLMVMNESCDDAINDHPKPFHVPKQGFDRASRDHGGWYRQNRAVLDDHG